MKLNKKQLLDLKERNRKYREKTLNKTKKFFTGRFKKEEGEEIKEFIKEYNIPIKKIIEEGTEEMWKEIEND